MLATTLLNSLRWHASKCNGKSASTSPYHWHPRNAQCMGGSRTPLSMSANGSFGQADFAGNVGCRRMRCLYPSIDNSIRACGDGGIVKSMLLMLRQFTSMMESSSCGGTSSPPMCSFRSGTLLQCTCLLLVQTPSLILWLRRGAFSAR